MDVHNIKGMLRGIRSASLVVSLLTVSGMLHGGESAEDDPPRDTAETDKDQPETLNVNDIPLLPQPAQDVDKIMEERDEQEDVMPTDFDYPAIPGCGPIEGDVEALPLLDRAHRTLSRAVCGPADQMDARLGSPDPPDESDSEPEIGVAATGTALLRLSTELDFQPDAVPEPGLGLSASIALPRAYNRVAAISQRQVERMGWEDALNGTFDDVHWLLRPIIYTAALTDIGLNGFYPFVRLRVPFERSYDNQIGWLVRPEVYWRWDDGAGVATDLQLSYPYDSEGGIVFSNRIETNEQITEVGDGWSWSQTLTYRQRLRERSTIITRARVDGQTEPDWQAQTLRTDLRLRRSAWRPWLYAEVEPYLTWTREDDFEQTPGIIFRVEVQLGDYPLRDAL